MEKLIKAINSTKQFYGADNGELPRKDGLPMPTKSERQENCKVIVECILSTSVKSNAEYPGLLGITLETLLQACQDAEADIRIAAEESLNRVIKSTDELLFGKVHLEFYKEIKRNGAGRSLRAALVRFANMVHKIRPNKCRPYVMSLLPALIRICQRPDENIQECLAVSAGKIFPHLGSFAAESELQVFLDALIVNLSNASATIRRTAAACIFEVVRSTRKTQKKPLLNVNVAKIISHIANNPTDTNSILGGVVALRYLVPLMGDENESQTGKPRTGSFGSDMSQAAIRPDDGSQVVGTFELCCNLICHPDPNIVTASLETLQTLLKLPNGALGKLVGHSGLSRTDLSDHFSRLFGTQSAKEAKSGTSVIGSSLPSASTPDISSVSPYQGRPIHPQLLSEPQISSSSAENPTRDASPDEVLDSEDLDEEIANKLDNVILSAEDSADSKQTPVTQNESSNVSVDGATTKSFDEVDSSSKLGFSQDQGETRSESAPERSTTTSGREENSAIQAAFINNVFDLYLDKQPLTVLAKLLCERILKVGGGKVKTEVRVSVKNLALSCLGLIVKLRPNIMFLPVLGHSSSLSSGHVLDVLSYKTFYDPQIRATVIMLVSYFISSALMESKNDYDAWIPHNLQVGARAVTSVEHLCSVILSGFADNSLVCVRAGIAAVRSCVHALLNSTCIHLGLRLLRRVLDLKDTTYWLVKVEIMEMFCGLNFTQIIFISEAVQDVSQARTSLLVRKLQQGLLEVAVGYISDRDVRVRKSASGLFIALVSCTGTFIGSRRCNMTTSETARICQAFNAATASPNVGPGAKSGEDKNLLKVHRGYEKADERNFVAHSLSSAVSKLTSLLLSSKSKHLTQGCIHALLALSGAYPVSKYPTSYDCDFIQVSVSEKEHGGRQNTGIVSTLVSMLGSSWLAAEIVTHTDVLSLTGNYLAGICYHGFEIVGPNPKISEQESLLPAKGSSGQGEGISPNWSSVLDRDIGSYVSRLFGHILKLISIFHHVIADASPTVQNKSVLQTLQTTPSIANTLKKKDKSDSKESGASNEHNTHKKSGSLTKAPDVKEDGEKDKTSKSSHNSPFSFAHSRVYMKVYELLVGAYESYKVTVDLDETDRFCSLLQAMLDVFSQVLEITTFDDIEKHTEEILSYLKTIFAIEPTLTVHAVHQLLKALFGTNLVSHIDLDWTKQKQGQNFNKDPQHGQASLYHQVFHHPLNDLTMAIANASFHHYLQSENAPKAGTGWFGSIKKKVEKKLTMTAKRSKGDKMSVQNYIRLFETVVIKSLKNYTMSGSVYFQRNVLNLLAQLVQLRVNYCLLDSDQIFIGFLIKQFEAIEGGLVKSSEVLIPHLFFFLVLLSYEKHHSKSVVTMPKIIQLCDGVMASGCDVSTHAIPALRPIVHDLFVLRGNMKHDNTSDLDTQREVIQSMLFRIIEQPEVLVMVTTILQYYRKENPEQWKRYSRQVTDVILPLMTHLRMNIQKYGEMSHLHSLFEALSPTALRPIDLVLNIFFLLPPDLKSMALHARWLAKTLSLLRVLLCHLKEDYILLRIKEMGIDVNVISCQKLSSLMHDEEEDATTVEPTQNADTPPSFSPEDVLSRTFLQLIGVTVDRLVNEVFSPSRVLNQGNDLELLAHLLCEFLLTVTYICRSGSFKQVTKSIHGSLSADDGETGSSYSSSHICIGFHQLAQHQPVVTLLWSQLLACVGFMELPVWGRLSGKYDKDQEVFADKLVLNRGAVHRGSIIMLADYICQNQSEVELMSWLIVNHTSDVVTLQSEPPIQDFISAIHRSPPGSGLFIESIRTLLSEEKKYKVAFKKQILYCLKGLHLEQSDALVVLLLNDWFVFSPVLAVSEFSSRIACDRLEMLLSQSYTEERKESIVERLRSVQNEVNRRRTVPRLARLRLLVQRVLCTLTGDQAPASPTVGGSVTISPPDKEWYKKMAIPFIQRCQKSFEIVQVLSVLDEGDIADVLKAGVLPLRHLDECIAFGISEITNPNQAASRYSKDTLSTLLKASLEVLISKLDEFLTLLPPAPTTNFASNLDQSVFEIGRRSEVSEYWDEAFRVFESESNRNLVFLLCRSCARCLLWQRLVDHPFTMLESFGSKLLRLVYAGFELLVWMMMNGQPPTGDMVLICLEAAQQVLQLPEAQTIFSKGDNLFYTLTIANCTCTLVSVFSGKLQIDQDADAANSDDTPPAYSDLNSHSLPVMVVMKSCQLMQKFSTSDIDCIPSPLLKPFEFVVRQVLCHPFFNNLARVPASLFKSEMKEDEIQGLVRESPSEYLQEKDMLREFINRINKLGWISRMQFEETWTSLLGVLVSQPIGDGSQNASPVDENAIQISCLTIGALTSLVVNSSMKPQGGQPATGCYQSIPRASPKTPLTKIEHELHAIHCLIEREMRDAVFGSHLNETFEYNQVASNCLNVVDHAPATLDVLRSLLSLNPERKERDPLYYGLGQRSIKSFQAMYGISPLDEDVSEISSEDENLVTVSSSDESDENEDAPATQAKVKDPPPTPRPTPVRPQSVDAHSCVQFMIDLFSEWFHSASKVSVTGTSSGSVPAYSLKLPRQFLCECLRSLLLISDFFTERQQFEWMFSSLNSLQTVQPCEDDVMLQYLVLGMCKSGSILGLGKRICEILIPMLETALSCAVPSCHVFALQGALYILECEPKEYIRPLIALLSRFVCERFRNVNLLINLHSHQTIRHVIAVGFFLIENSSTVIASSHASTFIQGAIAMISRCDMVSIPDDLYVLLVKSLEGLVTSYSVSSVDCEAIGKLATDQFSSSKSMVRMLSSLKLMVTCMYYRVMRVSETNASEEEALEARLLSMERITFLFDRIRAGFPQEGRILVQVLPRLLGTFFSTQDRMNKVIGEFVSNLHPFPDLIATVLHSVFQTLHNHGETDLIHSWVMLSLGNFTQRTPISAATWCLTCIFVSASTNHWINSLLPLVLAEVHARGPDLDYEKFYVSAADFYGRISEDLDRRTFHSIFKAVAEPGSPYQKLLDIVGPP